MTLKNQIDPQSAALSKKPLYDHKFGDALSAALKKPSASRGLNDDSQHVSYPSAQGGQTLNRSNPTSSGSEAEGNQRDTSVSSEVLKETATRFSPGEMPGGQSQSFNEIIDESNDGAGHFGRDRNSVAASLPMGQDRLTQLFAGRTNGGAGSEFGSHLTSSSDSLGSDLSMMDATRPNQPSNSNLANQQNATARVPQQDFGIPTSISLDRSLADQFAMTTGPVTSSRFDNVDTMDSVYRSPTGLEGFSQQALSGVGDTLSSIFGSQIHSPPTSGENEGMAQSSNSAVGPNRFSMGGFSAQSSLNPAAGGGLSQGESGGLDLSKTNELLQQLIEEVRKGQQGFLPIANRNSSYMP